jgi:hypothetical protein
MKLHRIAVALALVACSSASSDSTNAFPSDAYTTLTTNAGTYRVEIRTAPAQPPLRGDLDLQLRVLDANGAPVDDLALTVVPWMPTHGHGASVVPSVTPQGNGAYNVEHVDLFMPGRWLLQMTFGANDAADHATASLDVQ